MTEKTASIPSLRVLMVNRSDAQCVSGGDVIQLEKTRQGLQKLGISVDVRLADKWDGDGTYDLIHIFNIQSVVDSWRACQVAKDKGLPIVLSPIYWNPWSFWYWANSDLGSLWRGVRKLSGRWGYGLYALWRQLRSPASETWQLQRHLLMAADMVLPNSQMEAELILRDFHLWGCPPTCEIVPNAIERRLFDPVPKPALRVKETLGIDAFVLEVGRISPEKNTLGLIEALWDVDVPLVFVGSPSPYAPDYAERCYIRGQERGNVYFLEWLPYDQLPGVYALAAVHALPTWRETPGLASLEAAAAGCRIVSTSIGSAYEYFGDEAWYCHPADAGSIRRVVVSALNAPRSEMLRERVLENYTWDTAAKATLSAYQAVCRVVEKDH